MKLTPELFCPILCLLSPAPGLRRVSLYAAAPGGVGQYKLGWTGEGQWAREPAREKTREYSKYRGSPAIARILPGWPIRSAVKDNFEIATISVLISFTNHNI